MVGTVNASPNDFRSGVDDLIEAEGVFPGWLNQLLTTPIRSLENFDQMIRALTEDRDAIQVYVESRHTAPDGAYDRSARARARTGRPAPPAGLIALPRRCLARGQF
jgi:hypothetical protein